MFFRVQVFLSSRLFRVQVSYCPGFSGSRFFRVLVFLSFSLFRVLVFTVQAFLGPRSGSRFFRVWVQGLGPGFRSSLQRYIVVKFIFHFNRRSHHPAQKRKKKNSSYQNYTGVKYLQHFHVTEISK